MRIGSHIYVLYFIIVYFVLKHQNFQRTSLKNVTQDSFKHYIFVTSSLQVIFLRLVIQCFCFHIFFSEIVKLIL